MRDLQIRKASVRVLGQSLVGAVVGAGIGIAGMALVAQLMLSNQKVGRGLQSAGDFGLAIDNLRVALSSSKKCQKSFVLASGDPVSYQPAPPESNPRGYRVGVDKVVLRDDAGAESLVVLERGSTAGAATIEVLELLGTGVSPIQQGAGANLKYRYPVELRIVAKKPDGSPGLPTIERKLLLYVSVPQSGADAGKIASCSGAQAGISEGAGALAGFLCGPPAGTTEATDSDEVWVVGGFDDAGIPKCVKVNRPPVLCYCCPGAVASDLPGSIMRVRLFGGYPTNHCMERRWPTHPYGWGEFQQLGQKGDACSVGHNDSGPTAGVYMRDCTDGTGWRSSSLTADATDFDQADLDTIGGVGFLDGFIGSSPGDLKKGAWIQAEQ